MPLLHCIPNRGRGFTLIELAVVVAVITLLIGSLFVPLATQARQRNVSDTQLRLAQVQDALMGFALVNGRFPCPATVSSPPQPTDQGVEAPAGGGVCTHAIDGYVPGITLGLTNLDSQGFVVDAWGLQQNRIRYSITGAPVAGAPTWAFTKPPPNGMQSLGIGWLGDNVNHPYLYVCSKSPSPPSSTSCVGAGVGTLSNGDAVFVVYSLGRNAATTGGTSADEAINVKSTTNTTPVFVSKTEASATGTEFDDLVLWGSRYIVIGRLSAAGQLP